MGKDREGKFHTPKGKPSGAGKQKGEITVNTQTRTLQSEIEEKYIVPDTDDVAANVRMRHPNRNVDKGAERKLPENKKNPSNKGVIETFSEDFSATKPEELPGILSKEIFQQLAAYESVCCISIYIPTHQSGVEVNEQVDLISFKNALQQISSELKEKIDQTLLTKMLEPAYELLRNDKFWYSLSPGLACFIADGFFKYIKLPIAPEEKLLINTAFFLSPMVPVITSKEYFYLLVLSKKQAKFYRVDNFGIKYIAISEMPNGVDDVVHFEEKEGQQLFRTGSSGGGGGASFHGMGSGTPDEKEHISIYLEEVDETLWKEVLSKENAPLLLAGVEYLIPLYRKVSHYNYISDKNLTGSLEHEDENKLYRQARELMEPYFLEGVNKAKEKYGNQSATTLTSSIPEDVIPAAYYSRVSILFAQKNEQIWGTFDKNSNELLIHDKQEDKDDSLMDKAILKTLLNGGEVFIMEKEQMPSDSKLAALMRY
jgi:hypothetical protein